MKFQKNTHFIIFVFAYLTYNLTPKLFSILSSMKKATKFYVVMIIHKNVSTSSVKFATFNFKYVIFTKIQISSYHTLKMHLYLLKLMVIFFNCRFSAPH
jgi:hypothetical protein